MGCTFTYQSLLRSILIVAAAFASSLPGSCDDWPLARHDAQNTGRSVEELRPPFRLAWRVDTQLVDRKYGSGITLLATKGVVCAGSVPVTQNTHLETRLYSEGGTLLWRIAGESPIYLHGDALVTIEQSPTVAALTCYDWRSHRVRWQRRYPAPAWANAVTVAAGLVLCFTTANVGYGPTEVGVDEIALADGALARHDEVAAAESWAGAAVGPDRLYLGFGHSLDVFANGLKSHKSFYDGGVVWPMATGDYVVAQGWDEEAQAMDISRDKLLWRRSATRDVAPCLTRDHAGRLLAIVDLADTPGVNAVDVATGQTVWTRPLNLFRYSYPSGCAASLAASGRFVYAPGGQWDRPGAKHLRGGFYCLMADTGKPHWSYQATGVQGTAVIVSNEALYGLDDQARLYRFVRRARRAR